MTDELKKYMLSDRGTRVQAVRLGAAWRSGLSHQSLPLPVQTLLGELVAAATLLAANLKFEGSLVLQLQGDGPVALLVVECTADLRIRATASVRDEHDIPDDAGLQSLLNANGEGRFIVVLDPGREDNMQPYQGIVPLEGDRVSDVLELYMHSSEQLETRLWLAADSQHCAGLLLQRLPGHGGTASRREDDTSSRAGWEEISHLFETVQTSELLSDDTDTLLHKLLWEQDLIAFEPQSVRWHCPCTRERVADMLRMLGRDEVLSILDEQEQVNVCCNFCGKPYAFDAIDCSELFLDHLSSGTGGTQTVH